MDFLAYLGRVLWRLQLIGSFVALNVFPIAAALLVNGLLLFTSQGSELIQDLWGQRFIQDGYASPSPVQLILAGVATLIWSCILWVTSRLLCDTQTPKTLVGFARIRTNVPEALFVRRVGPTLLALCSAAPLGSMLLVATWTAIALHRQDKDLLLDRALWAEWYAALGLVAIFLLLYEVLGRWRSALATLLTPMPMSLWGRRARALVLVVGSLALLLALVALPGTPVGDELTPESVHGKGLNYYRNAFSAESLIALAIGLALLFVGHVGIRSSLARSWSKPRDLPRTRPLLALLLVQLVVCTGLVVLLVHDGVGTAQQIGLLLLLMGVGTFWSTLFSLGLVILPQRLGGPSLAVVPLVFFVLFSGRNDNHEMPAATALKFPLVPLDTGGALEECLKAEDFASRTQLDAQLGAWLRAHMPTGETTSPIEVPLIVLSGSGGGVRAAEFFARTMTKLDELTNGRFGDHVFAVSTVSGASLGAAVWIKARRASFEQQPTSPQFRFRPTRILVSSFFSRDYISPAVGAMLTRDAVQQLLPFVLPGGDRARVMEAAWDRGWSNAIEIARLESPNAEGELGLLSSSEENGLGSLASLASAGTVEHPPPPLVVFNATEVHTGRRFLVSNARLPLDWFPDAYVAIGRCSLHRTVDMPLATAAHLGARFTLISPAATIRGLPDEPTWEAGRRDRSAFTVQQQLLVPWGQVVDGGYFENYGATTAKELAQGIVASFSRLKEQGLVPPSVTLRLVGLSVVNDPLDLGNVPLHVVHRAKREQLGPHSNTAGPVKMQVSEPRFEAVWPVAGAYDVRETLGLMGIATPLADLTTGSRVLNELMAPAGAVLRTRESRGLTAEREFMEYVGTLGATGSAAVRGCSVDVRLGRMLRDAYLLEYADGGDLGSPKTPTFGKGEHAMPSPGLAWWLSSKSRQGMEWAIDDGYRHESRYQSETDLMRVLRVFDSACETNLTCRKGRGPNRLDQMCTVTPFCWSTDNSLGTSSWPGGIASSTAENICLTLPPWPVNSSTSQPLAK
jgi:hypothetical protein